MSDKEYPPPRKGSLPSPQGVLPGTPSLFDNLDRSRRRFRPASRLQRNKCNRMQHEIEKHHRVTTWAGARPGRPKRPEPRRKNATKPNTNHKNGHGAAALRRRSPTVAHCDANPNSQTTQCQAKLQIILATITNQDNLGLQF